MERKQVVSHFIEHWDSYVIIVCILVFLIIHFYPRQEDRPIKVMEDPHWVYCDTTTTWCLTILNYSGDYPSPAINCTTINATTGMDLNMIDQFLTNTNISESTLFHASKYREYKELCYSLNKTEWRNSTQSWDHYENKIRISAVFNATWELKNTSWVTIGIHE